MITAFFLLLAAPESGVLSHARASAAILSGQEIDLHRFEELRDDRSSLARSIEYQRADEDSDGEIRRFLVIEFQ